MEMHCKQDKTLHEKQSMSQPVYKVSPRYPTSEAEPLLFWISPSLGNLGKCIAFGFFFFVF